MKRIIFSLIGIAIVIITVAEVRATRGTQGAPRQAAAPPSHAPISAEGRMVTYPGAEVTVSSDVSGTLDVLSVQEKDPVRKGEVLAVIRANDTRAALAEAKARVGEADADIRLFELQAERAKQLWRSSVGSRQAWDQSERDLDAARARRASALAEVGRLEAVIAKTVIVAPIDGVVITRNVHPGETIAAGQSVVAIADLRRTRVEAEVDEFDAARVHVGQSAWVTAEGYDGQKWRGTVEEIPDSVTGRRLKPQDNGKPVDTRVLLVKVVLAEATPLKLGQRVELQLRRD